MMQWWMILKFSAMMTLFVYTVDSRTVLALREARLFKFDLVASKRDENFKNEKTRHK